MRRKNIEANRKESNSIVNIREKYDNMSLGDAQEIYMYIEKQEILKNYSFPKTPSKDGYYRIYVSDNTKKSGRRQLTAKDLDTLMDKVYAFEKGIKGRARKTFKDVYEIALSEKLKYIKDSDRLLSRQNTINKNRSDYKRYFEGTAFEKRYIDEITKSEIEDIVYFNLDRYNLRDKAMISLKSILRSTFNLAYSQYWISDNVFDRCDFNKFQGMILDNVDVEKRVHSQVELARILEEIHRQQERKPSYVPAYALEMQILCGCRRGEIPPLELGSIHENYIEFSKEQITVKRFNDVPEYCKIVDHTKTYKNRNFPRYSELDEFLNRLMEMHDKYYPKTSYLFPADNDNGVISNYAVYNYYHRICKKLGIKLCREEIKGTHSFRRNAITDVVNASGGNLVLASEIFGNSPMVAKKNYYTGIDLSEATKILNKRDFNAKTS